MPRPKQPKITIVSLIRERLKQSPATCGEVWEYTHKQNAPFSMPGHARQRKSVSGQLTDMKSKGEVDLKNGVWSLKR